MAQILTTMTQRGQVTVPAAIRRLLGLKRGDKVVFEVTDGVVTLSRPKHTLESAFGSIRVPEHLRGRDLDELVDEAKAIKAEEDRQRGL